MDYFSKFLRQSGIQPAPKPIHDHAQEFHHSWLYVKNTLLYPDERQLSRGIQSTDVPAHLQSMVDSLVWESTRVEEGGTGACLEYLLKNDVLGTLVKLSEQDRPFGIQAEVLRAVQNMVVLLDEQFLVHTAVHKAVLRLLRNCAGDDLHEQLDGRNKVMGAAKDARKTSPSEYEEDLVNLLCILCSRIRTYRELLMIFFHDRHWYRSEPLFAVEEEDEDEDEEEEEREEEKAQAKSEAEASTEPPGESSKPARAPSPTGSQATVTSAPTSSTNKKPEYEFLLFNYLLRFVHREGQIGDFARAGLLFLMDVAMSPGESVHRLTGDDVVSPSSSAPASELPPDPITDAALALAEYVLDGDFSEVLGAGLSAVYSLLPSKLDVRPAGPADANQSNGMMIGSVGPETDEERERREEELEKNRPMGMEDSSNPDFRARLDHFLKLLEFLQDVIRRNVVYAAADVDVDPSAQVGFAIVQSILGAIRRIFLENILYPSILECSENDGSAVAVMSYIEIIVRDLGKGEVADLFVNFLTSEDNEEISQLSRKRPAQDKTAPPQTNVVSEQDAKRSRRRSAAMMLLEMEAPDSKGQSDYLTSMGRFTLKDLLMTNLRSKSQPTATAALQLLQSMLLQQCHTCVDKLIVVFPDPKATSFPLPPLLPPSLEEAADVISPVPEDDDDDETFLYPGSDDQPDTATLASYESVFMQPQTTYSTHEREMGLYLALVSRVDPSHSDNAFSTGYDHYLRDALIAIESHSCFHIDADMESRAKLKHKLNPNDPILTLILESLRRFFSNTPDFNMALTGVLSSLAICPDRSLAGWLTFASDDSQGSAVPDAESSGMVSKDDGDDRSVDFRIEEKLATFSLPLPASSMDPQSQPVVHSILHGLVAQLERYRQQVDNFDRFLLERRQGLLFSENLTDALTLALEVDAPMKPRGHHQSSSIGSGSSLGSNPSTPSKTTRSDMLKASTSFVSNLLSPKKHKTTKSLSAAPSTPPRRGSKSLAASPFGPHYKQTGSISVEPYAAALPASGPWTPPTRKKKWNVDEEDVFAAGGAWGGDKESSKASTGGDSWDSEEEEEGKEKETVTLSRLLDNVVILEESIKELAAIIHARRSLGIDSVRYL